MPLLLPVKASPAATLRCCNVSEMKLELHHTVTEQEAGLDAASLLSQLSQLPKQRIKDAMTKGAVILKRKQRKRLRRATEKLLTGDRLSLSYDDKILSAKAPCGTYCLEKRKTYSVWFKPAGLMSQGTAFGDHLSILRIAELQFNTQSFLVHRLDRETSGIMLIAHTKATAAKLSKGFEQHQIKKVYQAQVLGRTENKGVIDRALDGKPALTYYECIHYDADTQQTLLHIRIETGRMHQIRRHLAAIGHPVMGDPKYGSGNKNREGLQLSATELSFDCPETRQPVCFKI